MTHMRITRRTVFVVLKIRLAVFFRRVITSRYTAIRHLNDRVTLATSRNIALATLQKLHDDVSATSLLLPSPGTLADDKFTVFSRSKRKYV